MEPTLPQQLAGTSVGARLGAGALFVLCPEAADEFSPSVAFLLPLSPQSPSFFQTVPSFASVLFPDEYPLTNIH
jgi:hypothetical protein